MRHPDYRRELDGMDPVVLLAVPLALVMLSAMIIRTIIAATVV